jgi:hypothetical protein
VVPPAATCSGEWSVCCSLQEGPAACSIACMRYFWGCGHRQRRRNPFVEARPGVRTIVGMRAHRNSSGMDQSRNTPGSGLARRGTNTARRVDVKKESARLGRGRPFRIVSRSIQLPVTKRRPHTHPRIAAANLCPMRWKVKRFKSGEHIIKPYSQFGHSAGTVASWRRRSREEAGSWR